LKTFCKAQGLLQVFKESAGWTLLFWFAMIQTCTYIYPSVLK